MKLEYYPAEKFKREVLEITQKYLNIAKYKIFIFGSRVNGDNFLHSDIDVGILGDVVVPPDALFNIKEELDKLPMLYKIDLVDLKTVPLKFRKEALKKIEYV